MPEISYHIINNSLPLAGLCLQILILKMPIKLRLESAHAYKHLDISR